MAAGTPKYITKSQLRKRYGDRSRMWVDRILKRDPRFPRPFHLPNSQLDFFDLAALEQYERECVANPPPRAAAPTRTEKPKRGRRSRSAESLRDQPAE
jgi:hypothetical protein